MSAIRKAAKKGDRESLCLLLNNMSLFVLI